MVQPFPKTIDSSRLTAYSRILAHPNFETHTGIRPTLAAIFLKIVGSTSVPHETRFIYFFLDMRTVSRTVTYAVS